METLNRYLWIWLLAMATILFLLGLISDKYGADATGKRSRDGRTALHLAIVWLVLWTHYNFGGASSFFLDLLVLLFGMICVWVTYNDVFGARGGLIGKADDFMWREVTATKAYVFTTGGNGRDHAEVILWTRRGLTIVIILMALAFG